jgi:hypothetical protein
MVTNIRPFSEYVLSRLETRGIGKQEFQEDQAAVATDEKHGMALVDVARNVNPTAYCQW